MAFTTASWVSVDGQLGWPAPGTIDSGIVRGSTTYPSVPVGTVAKFRDNSALPALGTGEFIFLPGVASTVAGDVVVYSVSDGAASGGSTTRWDGTASTGKPVAIATAATVASTWGWYQIGGAAVVNCAAAVAADAAVYYGGTTAQVDDSSVAGKQLAGATFASADDGGTPKKAIVTINRPVVQTQYGS